MPEVVICEMLRLAPPELVIVIDFVLLLPTTRLPKLRLAGLTLSTGAGGVTPVPLRETVGLVAALLVNETCPEALLADAGANCTV